MLKGYYFSEKKNRLKETDFLYCLIKKTQHLSQIVQKESLFCAKWSTSLKIIWIRTKLNFDGNLNNFAISIWKSSHNINSIIFWCTTGQLCITFHNPVCRFCQLKSSSVGTINAIHLLNYLFLITTEARKALSFLV